MDKVQKYNSFNTITPSSESYRNYLAGWKAGSSQSRSGRGGEEKNSQPLPGLEPPTINQPVDQRYTTELSGLLI
jgi:hypothetical protein